VVAGGVPFRGGDGAHPESGHIAVGIATSRCYCGRSACWEQAASRQALQGEGARLLGLAPNDPTVLPQLSERATGGDAQALRVFRAYGAAVAEGLGTLMGVYRPQVVVLGGSASRYFPHFSAALESPLRELGEWISSADVRATELEDHGGAVGAALAASSLPVRS
jgi:glucokinase